MKFLLLLLLPVISTAQVPRNAKTIIVKNVSFAEVCSQLLDKGYIIEKKDDHLQTVRTEQRRYTIGWNAAYKMDIRVKDSVAYITGTFSSPHDRSNNENPLYNNDPIYNHTSKSGKPHSKSLPGYAFAMMNEFALSFHKPIEYSL